MPYGEKRGFFNCPRMGQLLFNESVQVLARTTSEVKIRIPHLCHSTQNQLYDTYWTQSSALQNITETTIKSVPITGKQEYITLRKAFFLNEIGQLYSAGTRFVRDKKKDSKDKYGICLYCSQTKKIKQASIVKNACLNIPQSKRKKQKLIVELCKEWAHQPQGVIPYVFGGMSITESVNDKPFIKELITFKKNKKTTFFERYEKKFPRAGIDCARMITRAAQMVDAPFFATNTSAFSLILRPLEQNESVENGDLILWKGHVALISDKDKGLLIEARSYDDGYGKVQEIPYHEELQNIKTTQDLRAAHFKKMKLTRLNKACKKSHFIYDLSILKFSSLWEE